LTLFLQELVRPERSPQGRLRFQRAANDFRVQRPVRVQRGLLQQQGCPARHHRQDTGKWAAFPLKYTVFRIRIRIGSVFSRPWDPDPRSVFRMRIPDLDPVVQFLFFYFWFLSSSWLFLCHPTGRHCHPTGRKEEMKGFSSF